MTASVNNRRIAKNTLFLYFRMILVMGVSLYTSRIILEALGVNDYGIYNVVGGIVALFSLISGSLSAAIARFLTFELGTGNKRNLEIIFSTSLSIQLCLSAVEVSLKLGASFILLIFGDNRLIIYAILIFMISLVIRAIYGMYCGKHFEECHVRPTFQKKVFKEMSQFAGWNFLGATQYASK